MKLRTQFVSNSSTSSFVGWGYATSEIIITDVEKLYEKLFPTDQYEDQDVQAFDDAVNIVESETTLEEIESALSEFDDYEYALFGKDVQYSGEDKYGERPPYGPMVMSYDPDVKPSDYAKEKLIPALESAGMTVKEGAKLCFTHEAYYNG